MLVFEREDAQSDAWIGACRKLSGRNGGHHGADMSHSNSHSSHSSYSGISDTNQQHVLVPSLKPEQVQRRLADMEPNVIVIDRRSPSRTHDADALCR